MKARKGQGLSINMLVIIALAIFVVFLVIGFMSGGWSYFARLFGEVTPGGGGESAVVKCGGLCAQWVSGGCQQSGWLYNQVNTDCHTDVDWDNDGDTSDDGYGCLQTTCTHGAVSSTGDCGC